MRTLRFGEVIGSVKSRKTSSLHGTRDLLPSRPIDPHLPFDHQSDVDHPGFRPSLITVYGLPRHDVLPNGPLRPRDFALLRWRMAHRGSQLRLPFAHERVRPTRERIPVPVRA